MFIKDRRCKISRHYIWEHYIFIDLYISRFRRWLDEIRFPFILWLSRSNPITVLNWKRKLYWWFHKHLVAHPTLYFLWWAFIRWQLPSVQLDWATLLRDSQIWEGYLLLQKCRAMLWARRAVRGVAIRQGKLVQVIRKSRGLRDP